MRTYLLDRVRLVRGLMDGRPEVGYGDLVLILTAVISACAARRWPGEAIDRARFIELLAMHSPADMHCDFVCVPSLLWAGHITVQDTPWGTPGDSTLILRDDEVDLSFADALVRFSHLSKLDLKKHTYASLIYSWLRCPYAHEYLAGEGITTMAPSTSAARISYITRMYPDGILKRFGNFHIEYLIALTQYHAENVKGPPDANPLAWWAKSA